MSRPRSWVMILLDRGDAPLGLRVAEMGLLRYANSETLRSIRRRALSMLIERYHPVDPDLQ